MLFFLEMVFCLKANLQERKIIPVKEVPHIQKWIAMIRCKAGVLPTTYLHLPLGTPFRSYVAWDGIKEPSRRRFASGKKQYLSKDGYINSQ